MEIDFVIYLLKWKSRHLRSNQTPPFVWRASLIVGGDPETLEHAQPISNGAPSDLPSRCQSQKVREFLLVSISANSNIWLE